MGTLLAPDPIRAQDDPASRLVAAHRRSLLAAAVLLGAAVLVLWILAKTTSLFPPATDITAFEAWRAHHGPLRDLAESITALGQPGVALIITAVLAYAARSRFGLPAALSALASLAVVIPTTIAKQMPGQMTSLPSGHAAFAAAVGGYAAWLLLRAGHPRRALALAVLALAMAPARVIEGAHMTIDVVTGVALGIAWLLGVLVLERAWAARTGRALS
jgi:membrane-associated phospholipid phosphatase